MDKTDQILVTVSIAMALLGGIVGHFTSNIDVPYYFFGAAILALAIGILRGVWSYRKP